MITGRNQILGNLDRFIRGKEEAALASLIRAGFVIEAQAVKLAPLDTGNLRGGAETRWDDSDRSKPQVAVVFQAVYAARQHEEVDWKHTTGQAKFLSTAVAMKLQEIADRIARDLSV